MPQPSRDGGFTLIEVLVTITLMGALMAIAVGGYDKWASAASQSGSARELQSRLRGIQQRAITEGTALCVDFDTAHSQYTVFRGACGDAGRTKVEGPWDMDGGIRIESPSFSYGMDSTGHAVTLTGVTFTARGMATPGQVQVAGGGSNADTLRVSRLTGYVDLDD